MADQQPPKRSTTSSCSVCRHPSVDAINVALLGGTTVRDAAERYALPKSTVGRHKQNHLTDAAITAIVAADDLPTSAIELVDVHHRLSALVNRMERAIVVGERTRGSTSALVQAVREQRQALEALARIQADPKLKAAASLELLQAELQPAAVEAMVRMLKAVLRAFGVAADDPTRGRVVSDLMAKSLRSFGSHGTDTAFLDVDYGPAQQLVEREALEATERMEAEVQRRVAAELERRGRVLAIEAGPGVVIDAEVVA